VVQILDVLYKEDEIQSFINPRFHRVEVYTDLRGKIPRNSKTINWNNSILSE